MKLFARIFGCRRLSVAKEDGATLLNICMKYGFRYYEMGQDGEEVYLICPLHTASRVAFRCSELGVDCKLGEARGLPAAFHRYRKRWGLILGGLCAVFMIAHSQNFVWDIRVREMDGIDPEHIKAALAECGFEKGSDLRAFNADEVENLFLRKTPDVAWVSVNMKGTVAYVEATPKRVPEDDDAPTCPANVVAACDGVITEMITYSGLRMVEVGQPVREGQLLISGAYGEKTPGLHVTRAAGRVTAKTFRTLTVEIPLEYEEKVETGRTFSKKSIIFFGNSIKVFGNSGNLGSTCVKIIEDEILGFFGADLPVVLRTETEKEYTLELRQRSEHEARALALEGLEAQIKEQLGDAEILSRKNSFTVVNGVCRLECELVCLENIAKTVEFEADFKN
ncbi:MAG: sporulation protein YqfD [Clostridia bacterium]|nr:sporulation protein YqfD [Clostridia bacterium]